MKPVSTVAVKQLSAWTIVRLNPPGGSTLQWGAGRGVLCLAALFVTLSRLLILVKL